MSMIDASGEPANEVRFGAELRSNVLTLKPVCSTHPGLVQYLE